MRPDDLMREISAVAVCYNRDVTDDGPMLLCAWVIDIS